MDSYTNFAAVYDIFMDNVPYQEWSEYIISLLREYNIETGILLDLGCGTGSLTRCLAGSGYDMIGIDISADMLQAALEKQGENPDQILYLQQDMREFELYGTVSAVISVCDCLNYILEEEELRQVFRLVNNYLDPGGIFIFDLNTHYKYEQLLGDSTIAETREDCSFIWENYYDREQQLNEYALTIFQEEEPGLYRRYEELHYQRAYKLETIKTLLSEAGLEFLAVYDAFSRAAPQPGSERIYIIAREHGKSER